MASDASANIAKAQALKDQGNAAFKEAKYSEAIAAYHQIFMYVHGYSQGSGGSSKMPGQTTQPVSAEEMAQIRDLKLAHFSNLAMCHLKRGPNYEKARVNCSKALELDPRNVKALFRRGKCHAQLGNLDEAKEDLDRALALQPENKDAVRELRALKSLFATQRKKEQRKFAGLFDKLNADEAAEEAVRAAAASSSAAASSAVDVSEASAAPSAEAATVSAAQKREATVLGDDDDDDDMGEPLGAPQSFEPADVQFRSG